MGGTLMPGDSPGTLTIFGKYDQTGTGILDMLLGPQSHSVLDAGNVFLDFGSLLQIDLLDGFNPFGQTFEIMHYSTMEGEFVNGSEFWNHGFLWQLSYGQNALDVKAVSAPEPSSFLLLGIGLLALAGLAVRRTNSTNGNIPRA
jgi:PEP-CTERM motif